MMCNRDLYNVEDKCKESEQASRTNEIEKMGRGANCTSRDEKKRKLNILVQLFGQ